MSPSGQQLSLQAGPYAAVVTEVGASLRVLTHRGRPVTLGYGEHERMQRHRGAVLAPWPNRIGDGRYTFRGVTHQLPLTEVERTTALHGLVCWHPWTIATASSSTAILETRIWPQPGYDFRVDLRITYALTATGLHITLTARNTGEEPAPYGASIHPYLVAGEGRVDAWKMTVPASQVVDVDPVRLLPTGGTSPVEGTPLDFRTERVVGQTEIDHAFGDVIATADGIAVARVLGAEGRGAEIVWNAAACPWVQVHTADLQNDVAMSRRGMAIEPMTCPPDAFRTGIGLIALAPNETHSTSWTLRAL